MGTVVEVSDSQFESAVLIESHNQPVVVDFFATWCGPCQMLKPMLENLAQDYDMVLAKVDIDQNPALANAYGVEGVPDVKVFWEGQVVDGFVGVIPESDIRALLGKLGLSSGLETGLAAVRAAQSKGELDTVKRLFVQLIERYPNDQRLIIEAAKFLIGQDRIDSAEKLLQGITPQDKAFFPKAEGLRSLIGFKQQAANLTVETELDEQYLKGCQAAIAADYETALAEFLEIVGRDRAYQKDGARKAMVSLFNLLGEDHELTQPYRRRLMQALY
ncbi:MAG: tetratricopeptide repeat protein [Cyanobacteria bacterium J06635_15]